MEQEKLCGSMPGEDAHSPLIYGLPDDLALLCLVRVPGRYHHILKCVSKGWRGLVCSDAWYSYRQKLQLVEPWIYALCRNSDWLCVYVLDPSWKCWKQIKDPPLPCRRRYGIACAVLGWKLYLLGGSGLCEDASDEVYCYNALADTWEKVAPQVNARCHFVCESLNGRLFAVGGMGVNSDSLQTWETYDPHLQSWQCYDDPNLPLDVGESVTMDGSMYVRHISPDILPITYAAVYNPSENKWHPMDGDMMSGWRGPAAVVSENLYVLDQSSGTKLIVWSKKNKEWVLVGRLSTPFVRPPCCITAIDNSIFVVGRGLKTVAIQAKPAENIEGIMLSTSIACLMQSDHMVVACKAIAI